MEIKIPSRFNDLTSHDAEKGGFYVSSVWVAKDLSDSDLSSKIDDLTAIACNNSILNLTQSYIDDLYSLIEGFDSISSQLKAQCVESLIDMGSALTRILTKSPKPTLDVEERNSAKIIVFFICSLISKIESKSIDSTSVSNDGTTKKKPTTKKALNKSTTFDWNEWVVTTLETVQSIMETDQSLIWSMGIVQEAFLSAIWQPAVQIIENRPGNLSAQDKAAKAKASSLVVTVMKHFQNGSQSGSYSALGACLLTGMSQHENLAIYSATICSSANPASSAPLLREIMGEFAHMDMKNVSSTTVKNIGTFLETYCTKSPQGVVAYLPLLMQLADSPAYQIRSSLFATFGTILSYVHKSLTASQGENYEAKNKIKTSDIENIENGEDVQEDSEEVNVDQLFRARDSLLDILVERVRDVNFYARAEVLRVWSSLAEAGSIPVKRYGTVAELAYDRLHDKTAIVRKQAMALLVSLLDNNPFSGDLNIDTFEAMGKDASNAAKERLQAIVKLIKDSQDEEQESGEVEAKEDDIDEYLDHPDVTGDGQYSELQVRIQYCSAASEFISFVSRSASIVVSMCRSKTTSDLVEALRFFRRAVNFGIKDSAKHFRSCFSLIWHQEKSIREECLTSFKEVFLTDGSVAGAATSLSPNEICDNLVRLMQRCSDSKVETEALDAIVGELFINNLVSGQAITSLWSRIQQFLEKLNDKTISTSDKSMLSYLLCLLCVITKAQPSLLSNNKMSLVCDAGFHSTILSSDGDVDCTRVLRATCKILQNAPVRNGMTYADLPENLVSNIASSLRHILLGSQWGDDENKTSHWFSLAEESIYLLYHVHPCPDKFMTAIILPVYGNLLGTGHNLVSGEVSAARFSRFLFLLGQTASATLLYSEKLAKLAKTLIIAKATQESRAFVTSSRTGASEGVADDAMEEEMSVAAAADAEADRQYTYLTDNQLVLSNLLGKFVPMIKTILTSNHSSSATTLLRQRYANILIRQTSTLALCRYMSISSLLCEELLPLLFTVLERDADESIRVMVIVTVGDLAFRFPNAVEPWTVRIYDRLSDASLLVRYNALLVLSHLLLHDMLKVKGHVARVVACLCDEAEVVRDLAALLFIKLAERSNNPIYNLLGDIISTLSTASDDNMQSSESSSGVKRSMLTIAEFQSAMQFLLSFVKKDKQADALMERLLVRLAMAESLVQRRNLAFCAAELQITDKGVKRLLDMLKPVKASLYDAQIMDSVRQIVSKAKKSAKGSALAASNSSGEHASSPSDEAAAGTTKSSSANPQDNKAVFEEIEFFLEEVRKDSSGERADVLGSDPSLGPNEGRGKENVSLAKKASKTNKSKRVATKKKAALSDDEDDEMQYSDSDEVVKPVPLKSHSMRDGGRRAARVNCEEEEL